MNKEHVDVSLGPTGLASLLALSQLLPSGPLPQGASFCAGGFGNSKRFLETLLPGHWGL